MPGLEEDAFIFTQSGTALLTIKTVSVFYSGSVLFNPQISTLDFESLYYNLMQVLRLQDMQA